MPKTDPWIPEFQVSQDFIHARWKEFSDLPPIQTLKLLGSGWDNEVYQINEDLLLRLPKRTPAARILKNELRALPLLNERLSFAFPRILAQGKLKNGWDFYVSQKIPGLDFLHQPLTEEQTVRFAIELGEALLSLHQQNTDDFAFLPVDPNRRSVLKIRAQIAEESLHDSPRLKSWLNGVPELDLLKKPVLVHGDLHLLHALVLPDGGLGGLIDFGDISLGARGVDLSLGYLVLEGKSREAFFEASIASDDPVQIHACVMAIFYAAVLLDYAQKTGQKKLAEFCLKRLMILENDTLPSC